MGVFCFQGTAEKNGGSPCGFPLKPKEGFLQEDRPIYLWFFSGLLFAYAASRQGAGHRQRPASVPWGPLSSGVWRVFLSKDGHPRVLFSSPKEANTNVWVVLPKTRRRGSKRKQGPNRDGSLSFICHSSFPGASSATLAKAENAEKLRRRDWKRGLEHGGGLFLRGTSWLLGFREAKRKIPQSGWVLLKKKDTPVSS